MGNPMWSLIILGVHSHMVPITFKNVLRSSPPYTGSEIIVPFFSISHTDDVIYVKFKNASHNYSGILGVSYVSQTSVVFN